MRLTPHSLAPRVLDALRALGYALEECETVDSDALDDHRIWIVDAYRLDDFPDREVAPDSRLLVIASPQQPLDVDPRIIARTNRPARLGSVYEMIQAALEDTPRKSPRIATRLSARCIRSDRRSIGAVLSLSEGGCLLRTSDGVCKGSTVDLQFALPDYGLVSTRAECRYVRRGDAGLEFAEPPPDIRNTISQYVTLQLAAGDLSSPNDSSQSVPSA